MKNEKIKLGYEVEKANEVSIKPSHLIVTGLTQEAGKTTTLEALIKRSKKRAIVFRTKIGEKSFIEGTKIPPYFKDRSDWQFVQGLVEATIKEKLRSFERAKIIQICKQTGGNSLLDFKKKVDERLESGKLNGFEMDILTNLQAYLEIVLPKIQSINYSNDLELVDGLNIIDLERFSRDSEVQSLIIRSVAEEVLYNFKDVILVIPEAWKFLPQGRGNPCKLVVEEFIRQGATNNNFIWIDSQDMSNVDKVPLKQISTWILGYQSERNEVKHTIDQIPLPKKSKPTPDDIMNLGKGIFYLATREGTKKVYVQPVWLDDDKAIQIAKGELSIDELDAPQSLSPFKVAVKKETKVREEPTIDFSETTKRFNSELNDVRKDFFNKIEDVQEQINKVYTSIYELKNQPKAIEVDEETIVNKVIQKMPFSGGGSVDQQAIIESVLARVPKQSGAVTYEVAPLEKIKKDFLEEAKQLILSGASSFNEKEKKMFKHLEAQGKECKSSEIITKVWMISDGSSARVQVSQCAKNLLSKDFIKRGTHGGFMPNLKSRLESMLNVHGATEHEIQQVYDHILMEILRCDEK